MKCGRSGTGSGLRTPRRKPFSAVPSLCISLWILFLHLPGAYQQCSAGDGSVSVISDAASVSVFASQTQRNWDFQSLSAPPSALANQRVNLTCITATNVSFGPPTRAQFLSPLAIGVTGSSTLRVQDSVLSTDCDTLSSFQTYLCSTYAIAGSLSVYQGAINIAQWSDNRTVLRNVNITCPNSQTASPPPCHLTAVSTAAELLAAFTVYTAALSALSNATIIISSNISVSNSTWPRAPVEVTRNTTLRGTSLLSRPVLDFNLLVNMWHIPPDMIVVLENLTLANLAPAYFTPTLVFSQFGPLTERVWAFERYGRQLFIQDCTMAIPLEELSYVRYWFVFLLSSDPDARARADWLQVFDLEPPIINGTGVYLTVMRAFTIQYLNVLLTNTLGGTYPLLPQNLGLAQLQSAGVPLTAVNLANSSPDFFAALWPNNSNPDANGWRYVFLVENVTLGDAAWSDAVHTLNGTTMVNATTGAANIPGNLVIGRGSGFEVMRLGWSGKFSVLRVSSNASVTLRELVLSGLGPRAAPGGWNASLPLAVLAAPLWGLSLAPGPRRVMLDNCTVLVTEDELAVLLEVLVPLGQGSLTNISGNGSTWTTGAPEALRSGISTLFGADALELGVYHAGMLEVHSGATTRYSMRNVVFRLPDATAGEQAPSPGLRALGVPFGAASPTGGGGGSSFPGWAIAVIVVGSCLLLLLMGFVFYRWRRARQGEDVAYEKYLKRTAEQAGGTAGSDTGTGTGLGGATPPRHPSQELTTSSQVLRPGARASDPELGLRTGPCKGCLPGMSHSPSNTGVVGAASASQPTSSRGGGTTSSIAMNTLPATLPGLQGHAGQDSQLPFPLPLSERAQAELAVNLGSAVGLTDSFDRPPTSTALGQHGAGGRGGGSGPSGGHGRSGSVVTPSGAQLLNTVVSTTSGSTAAGAAPVDQMHQMIATMGREFGNDKQLVVHSVLGKGAHGTVYLGTWRGLQVAVKSMILRQEDQRHQHRPLMEAAISSNLAHRNIVTTYAYELRELEHEFASISPELARQGGGWRLLIIQEFCDGGPVRSLVDCGYFHTPPPLGKHSPPPQQPGRGVKVKKSGVGSLLMRRTDSNQASGGNAGATVDAAPVPEGFPHNAPTPPRRGSSSDSSGNSAAGSSGRGNGGAEAASPQQQQPQRSSPPGQRHGRAPAMDNPPSSMPPRPGNSLEAALRYVEASLQVACGLQHIHAKNIVHGDLNTNNVLVSRAPGTRLGYVLKVADFGLSVRMQEGESHLSNLFQGSPYYVAPEVVLSGKVGKAADTFSLGIIMWEFAHGQRPPWRLGARLRTYPSLNTGELEFAPEVPPRFARLTRDCFHASKDARPSMDQVVDTLTAIKEELEALRSKG